jgi:DNA cross-link repair 1A protein
LSADAVKSENFNPRVLFLFGTYTIGKERLFMEVARTLGKQVYVSKEKLQVRR